MTSFATTGNPNDNVNKADMQNVQWKPVDTILPPYKCLNIEDDLKFETLPESKGLMMLDQMFVDTNTPLY